MKIILHKLFPYAPYLNEYIGFEMDVPGDADMIASVEVLRKLAEKSHRERYPNLYPNGDEEIIKTFGGITDENLNKALDQTRPLRDTHELIKEDILSCENLKSLESYKFIKNQTPELTEAYNNKLKSFQ